jgi:hypothetical protein
MPQPAACQQSTTSETNPAEPAPTKQLVRLGNLGGIPSALAPPSWAGSDRRP